MKVVYILGTSGNFEDNEQEIILTVKQEKRGADLVMEGSEFYIKELTEQGIYHYESDKKLYPEDKLKFMEHLIILIIKIKEILMRRA